MGAAGWTSLGVSVLLIVFVAVLFAFGRSWLGLDAEGRVGEMMLKAATSPYTLVGVSAVFILLALAGFPQILLITMTILAFGAFDGALHAWVATMASATFTFLLGHVFVGRFVRRLRGPRAQRFFAFLDRHAIFGSALVRVTPLAPFLLVNAAAGGVRLPLWKFLVGTAIGIVPQIGLVLAIGAFTPDATAFEGRVATLVDFFTIHDWRRLALLAAVIPAWIALLIGARLLVVRLLRGARA